MLKMFITFYKPSTAYLVDTHQRYKSFISQIASIRFELSSSNAEKLCVSNFKIADYFFKLWVTTLSAV